RARRVTGVQTCALPLCSIIAPVREHTRHTRRERSTRPWLTDARGRHRTGCGCARSWAFRLEFDRVHPLGVMDARYCRDNNACGEPVVQGQIRTVDFQSEE